MFTGATLEQCCQLVTSSSRCYHTCQQVGHAQSLLVQWSSVVNNLPGLRKFWRQQRQEAQLSPRDPRDALYQLKYWPTVVRITQTHWPEKHFQQRPRFIPLPTYSCTRIVALGTTIAQRACIAVRVINILPYNQSWWCQLDRNCNQPTLTTTNVVDVIAYYSASVPSWTWTTAADGHKRFKTAKVTFKVNKGHPYWCHSIGHLRFAMSLQLQLCLQMAPFPRYYHLYPII